jgi:Eukaryotic aspartyl protease
MGEGGRIGLGLSPTSLSIWDQLPHLQNPIFSMYLNGQDDYVSKGLLPDYTDSGSELVFGGVNAKHYKGCLQWHPPSTMAGMEHTWSTGLRRISVINENDQKDTVSTIEIGGAASLDTSKPGIHGPPETIGRLASLLGLKCYLYGIDDEGIFPTPCNDANGYSVALIDCGARLLPIELVLGDGTAYRLTHEELVKQVEEEANGLLCKVDIHSDINAVGNMFALGNVFFHRHYLAFNTESKYIGIAESVYRKDDANEPGCAIDYPLDIAYYVDELKLLPGNDTMIESDDSVQAGRPMTKVSEYIDIMKDYSSNNPKIFIATSIGSFVSVVLLVLMTLLCRRRFLHRHYERADHDEKGNASSPAGAEEAELPVLL